MKSFIKKAANRLMPVFDVILLVFTIPSALMMKMIRSLGVQRLPLCRNMLFNIGVFPIRNHFTEPRFDHRETREGFSSDRSLPGIDWNEEGQLSLLDQLTYADEMRQLPAKKSEKNRFYFENGVFAHGDSEIWYQIIRAKKPARIYEIGSGFSTLMAMEAIKRNREEDPGYHCEHVCIEPYSSLWLEETGVKVVREPVETLGVGYFSHLQRDDILFIDSSHVINAEGDVVFEYLELLPTLAPGVIVHAHDIFSPKNYPKNWLVEDVRLWGEQYLFEAFLSHNSEWKIICALNYLSHHHREQLRVAAPRVDDTCDPSSFYIQRQG